MPLVCDPRTSSIFGCDMWAARPFTMTFCVLVRTLMAKNFRIVLWRNPWRAFFMALLVPVFLAVVFSYAKNLIVPPAVYGFGGLYPVKTLTEAFDHGVSSGRHKMVLIDNGHTGGDIQRVLDELERQIAMAGSPEMEVVRSRDESILATECRSTLRGVTSCFEAVVMVSSPSEGRGGVWNYSIRSDSEMWASPLKSMVDRSDKNEEVYLLPVQRAIDAIITGMENMERPESAESAEFAELAPDALSHNQELAFTSITQGERDQKVRKLFLNAIAKFMAVAFMLSIIWISFHMPGLIATERETGMSQLLDAMMPNDGPWRPLAARLSAHYLSFSVMYSPAWILSSVVMHYGVVLRSSFGIICAIYVLGGLGIASLSMFIASFFRKAQLSGVMSILVVALLGILAQAITNPSTAVVFFLSLFFTPCAFVFFIILMCRFERHGRPTNLLRSCPDTGWQLPGIVILCFIIVQIIVYPLLAALVEKRLYGTATFGRKVHTKKADLLQNPVSLRGFTKTYSPGLLSALPSLCSRLREPVVAVRDLSMTVQTGQIVALLGANGSGKSTTLEAIAGLKKLTAGTITVDGRGGMGIAPQKNVLWDDLTVEEHLTIFSRLKSPESPASPASQDEVVVETMQRIDLISKRDAFSRTLSGGQKRKLQLGIMLIGGSAVCCVDEVSSGIDPLSRRQLWDILLAERGKRTMIMTTHFLDEADLLADHIAILSKGTLRAQGSSVELKDRFGGGYRISVPHNDSDNGNGNGNGNGSEASRQRQRQFPDIPEVKRETAFDSTTYVAPTASLAYQVVKQLTDAEIDDYSFSSPTLENAFLELAEEVKGEEVLPPYCSGARNQGPAGKTIKDATITEKAVELAPSPSGGIQMQAAGDDGSEKQTAKGLHLLSGRRLTFMEQAVVLLRKRWTILRRNWLLYLVALVLPICAAGLTSLYVMDSSRVIGCSPADQSSVSEAQDIFTQMSANFHPKHLVFPVGPPSKVDRVSRIKATLPLLANSSFAPLVSMMLQNLKVMDSFEDFVQFTSDHRRNITTGLWLGDEESNPTIAWVSNLAFTSPLTAQQFLNLLLTNTTILTTWTPLERPFNPSIGRALNLVMYMGLVLAFYPAFFALYPSNERRVFVRSLQYSNGVRPFPLWVAYIVFDFTIIVVSSAVVTGLWAGVSDFTAHVEYVFVVLCLYGLASVLMAYLVSLFAKSQLATFAWAVFGQEIAFLCYLISYVGIITFLQASKIDSALLICHFVISSVMPIGSAVRALFLTTNLFSVACDGMEITKHPLEFTKFGGPIFCLIMQTCSLFGLLLWIDSGSAASAVRVMLGRYQDLGEEETEGLDLDDEMREEAIRVHSDQGRVDGLRLLNVTKSYGKHLAVDNLSFGIGRGEVFALLGPNGAGKSTAISLVRGDRKMSRGSGDIFIENASITKHLAAARANLGVCPQIDALDQLTVQEHLEFFAKIRGIPNIQHNVKAILQGVGLSPFSTRMASKLSGGNKRKLSLGIALMGNPAVVLLDEPSSGLDAAAKRIMWRTLETIAPGRSILLTTHNMEEAAALAGRAGIMDRRMLALGSLGELRKRFGDNLHVHLVSATAPRTTPEEMERIRVWVRSTFPTAVIEAKTYHGQVRFSVSEADIIRTIKRPRAPGQADLEDSSNYDSSDVESSPPWPVTLHGGPVAGHGAVARLVVLLEESKIPLRVEYYSVSPTTLDQVFLNVMKRHHGAETPPGEERQATGLARVLALLKTGRENLVKLLRAKFRRGESVFQD